MQEEMTRYYFVDGIRGIAIINMVIFHFLYDIYIVYKKYPIWYSLPAIHIWQQMICWTFIFISGFVCFSVQRITIKMDCQPATSTALPKSGISFF